MLWWFNFSWGISRKLYVTQLNQSWVAALCTEAFAQIWMTTCHSHGLHCSKIFRFLRGGSEEPHIFNWYRLITIHAGAARIMFMTNTICAHRRSSSTRSALREQMNEANTYDLSAYMSVLIISLVEHRWGRAVRPQEQFYAVGDLWRATPACGTQTYIICGGIPKFACWKPQSTTFSSLFALARSILVAIANGATRQRISSTSGPASNANGTLEGQRNYFIRNNEHLDNILSRLCCFCNSYFLLSKTDR